MSDLACFAFAFALFVGGALHAHAHGQLIRRTATPAARRPARKQPKPQRFGMAMEMFGRRSGAEGGTP